MVKDGYTIIARFPMIEYVLLNRHTNYNSFVAAWAYDDNDGTWGQGHYFENEESAREYIKQVYEDRCIRNYGERLMKLDERAA